MAALNARNMYLLMELLESSDSSDDDMILFEMFKNEDKPKIQGYISYVVNNYSDIEFRKNFRLHRATCEKLIADFRHSMHCPTDTAHGGVPLISAETHILSFLWFAGNKSCMRDVSSRFGIGESSFHRVPHRVMEFFLELAPSVIKFPNTHEAKAKLADDFKKVSGFPNVFGCIDGKYLPIRTPAHKIRSTYVNRHDQISITLQGICDVNRKFFDVFTGTPSKIHDSRVFKLSFIYREIPQICANRWHLLGDAAYPIAEWLLTPYRDYGNLDEARKNYNYKLSATRVLIENAFGILKGRFRQLVRTDFHSVDTTTKFAVTCYVLHNLCIDEGDLWEEVEDTSDISEIDQERVNANEGGVVENALKVLGENKRNTVCEELLRNQ